MQQEVDDKFGVAHQIGKLLGRCAKCVFTLANSFVYERMQKQYKKLLNHVNDHKESVDRFSYSGEKFNVIGGI